MTYMKISSLPVALGLMAGVGVLPSAMAASFELTKITNAAISCTGTLQNCQVKDVPQVSCQGDPAKVTKVTVSMGSSNMDSSLGATNTGNFGACYNIRIIAHTALTLRVPAANLTLNGPGNSGGSGITIPTGGCNASVDNPPWVYYRDKDGVISANNLLLSTKTQKVFTFNKGAPGFSVFVGSGTFKAQFEAQAELDEQKSGTWDGAVVTNATSSLTVTPDCETPPPPDDVPAIGPLGLGLLGLGLSGLGVAFGFRRRRG